MNVDNSIAGFLQRKLTLLNRENKIVVNDVSGADKVRSSMERFNANVDKIEFEGITLSPEDLREVKLTVPDAFKKKSPVTYTSTACHLDAEGKTMGVTSLELEVKF